LKFSTTEYLWKILVRAVSRNEESVVFVFECEPKVDEKYSPTDARDYTADNRIQKTENRRQISDF